MTRIAPDTHCAYIPTLDGWRAIAIVAVLISHSQRTFQMAGWQSPIFLAIVPWLRLGVDLFFAISGFLICNRLLSETHTNGSISLKNFYIRRAFRILPLYLFYLVALVMLSRFAGVHTSAEAISSCLFFYRNYADPAQGAYTNHFWSLAVEEHFYFLWPCFLAFTGLKRALWITPVVAILVHVWRSIDAHYHIFTLILPHAGLLWRTDTRIDALLWGCFAAMYCFNRAIKLSPLSSYLIFLSLVGAIITRMPALPLILAVLFPLLIVSTIYNPASVLGRFLELRSVRWIGSLSYSMYVWQTLFLQRGAEADPSWLAALKMWPLNYISIIALSIASHYLLEKPLIHLGRKVYSYRLGQPATSEGILSDAPLPAKIEA